MKRSPSSWFPAARRRVVVFVGAALASALVLTSCGGGGTDTADATSASVVSAAVLRPPASPGTLLQNDWGTYPRLVRLAHQADATQNGVILGSVTERVEGLWRPGIHASTDQGATFTRRTRIEDPGFTRGVCCGALFELPQAVGALPVGTLIYSASVGYDQAGAFMENRIYLSQDAGRSFRRLDGVHCGVSGRARVPNRAGTGVWEPMFFIAGDGSLACVFSDETVDGKSQVLRLTRTLDGQHWSAPVPVLQGDSPDDRPGMASVVRLPTGRFLMSFENCSMARPACEVRLKISDDGLGWGAVGDLGVRPQTSSGQFLRHTPTLAWAPLGNGTNGRLILTGQLVASDAGGVDPAATGRVVLVNDRQEGTGLWTALAAPIGLADAPAESNWCQNYSSAVLPLAGELGVLMWQSDLGSDGGCRIRYAQGALR